MNKLLLMMAAMLISVSAYAQKLEFDRVDDNGWRLIGTTPENIGSMTDRVKAKIDLGAMITSKGDTIYNLDFILTTGQAISAPAGARLLIKTSKGDIISLTESRNQSVKDDFGKKRMIPELQNMVVTEYSIPLMYHLTTEQIEQIMSGVSKIRIELDGGSNYDKEWKKDKVGKIIAKDYKLVNEAISTDNRASFTDNF